MQSRSHLPFGSLPHHHLSLDAYCIGISQYDRKLNGYFQSTHPYESASIQRGLVYSLHPANGRRDSLTKLLQHNSQKTSKEEFIISRLQHCLHPHPLLFIRFNFGSLCGELYPRNSSGRFSCGIFFLFCCQFLEKIQINLRQRKKIIIDHYRGK